MKKTVLLLGTFDTKEEEYLYVRNLIHKKGYSTLMMDTGVMKDPEFNPEISAAEVAKTGGASLKQLRSSGDRGESIEVMIKGVSIMAPALFAEGKFDAILGLGGGGGTNIATAAMRELPLGVPKVMVSTLASSDVRSYVGVKDITMIYSVTDIAGLNKISRKIFGNAAGAVCGMMEQEIPDETEKEMIAATMFGVTTPCVTRFRRIMEQAGYEVLVFHATGSGGRAMEELIEEGYFAGVADITTTEWCDEVVGGVLAAGPDRIGAAGRSGIPQVVSCGALDMVNFHSIDSVPEKFLSRNLFKHNPTVTLMRTSAEDCKEIGKRIAEKLNESTAPVLLFLPLKGVSMMDRKGQPFYDPEANNILFKALEDHSTHHVKIIKLNYHINDPEFAGGIAEGLLKLLSQNSRSDLDQS